jgi:hypothetical protein
MGSQRCHASIPAERSARFCWNCGNILTSRQLVLAQRQQLQREVEREQVPVELPMCSSHSMRHIAARLGTFLIAPGTRLRQLEQHRKQMAVD